MDEQTKLQRLGFQSMDLRDAFLSLTISSDSMEDDSSTDSETRDTRDIIKTTYEEKQGTIPESQIATAVAVSMSSAHGNPVVARDSELKRKRKLKKIKRKSKECKPPENLIFKKDDKNDEDKSKRQILTATRTQLPKEQLKTVAAK